MRGQNAYGMLESERGVHRLVRLSPFDAAHRRHTSFAAVDVIPEVAEGENPDVEIKPDDLRVETFKSGGAGGQYVNKTESAVRVIHVPTGIVVASQQERSQTQNREVALGILRAKLVARAAEERDQKLSDLRGERQANEWGSQIRSYVLQPYQLVKDHRTAVESGKSARCSTAESTRSFGPTFSNGARCNSLEARSLLWAGCLLYAVLFTCLGALKYAVHRNLVDFGIFTQTAASAFGCFCNPIEGSHWAFHFSPILYAGGLALGVVRSPLTLVALQALAGALVAPRSTRWHYAAAVTSRRHAWPPSWSGSIRRSPDSSRRRARERLYSGGRSVDALRV